MRQIVLDTETTGLEVSQGHRIIEIGCVEIVNRKLTGRHFHEYINPDREIDQGAFEVHGISNEFLQDKPFFSELAESFIDYVRDSELVIHNASFDVGFLDAELKRAKASVSKLADICVVTDSLKLARDKHPGQRNSLDALSKRYDINSFDRTLHGALLDSEILAEVYLRMTGGQTSLSLLSSELNTSSGSNNNANGLQIDLSKRVPRVSQIDEHELAAHEEMIEKLNKTSDDGSVWQKL